MPTLQVQATLLKANLYRGFADPSQFSILEALRAGKLSVSAIVEKTSKMIRSLMTILIVIAVELSSLLFCIEPLDDGQQLKGEMRRLTSDEKEASHP